MIPFAVQFEHMSQTVLKVNFVVCTTSALPNVKGSEALFLWYCVLCVCAQKLLTVLHSLFSSSLTTLHLYSSLLKHQLICPGLLVFFFNPPFLYLLPLDADLNTLSILDTVIKVSLKGYVTQALVQKTQI